MASITDSIKLVFTEKFAYLKIFILSYIPFVAIQIDKGVYSLGDTLDLIAYFILGLIYFGYMFLISAYTIQCKQDVLPPINPFKMFWIGTKGFIALIPSLTLCWCFYTFYYKNLNLEIMQNKIIAIVSAFLFLSIVFTSVIFYAKKFSIIEALNIKNIAKNFSQVFLYLILTFILLGIICALVSIPILALSSILFSKGLIETCIIIYLITATLFVYFQNLGYAYFEYIKEDVFKI